MITIRPATPADLVFVRALLGASSLPVQDIETSLIDFLVAEQEGTVLGVVGVQVGGDTGLLRSLAVDSKAKGNGLGQALVEQAETHARSRGVMRLVLLTETAATFFSRLGYSPAERANMPPQIQSTAEFSSLCPTTATCWSKFLLLP